MKKGIIKHAIYLLFIMSNLGAQSFTELTKFSDINSIGYEHLGSAVAISGDYAVAGCPDDNVDANYQNSKLKAGSVYLFYRNQGGTNNWGLLKKLCASDRSIDDAFGFSLAMDGDNLFIFARLEDEDENGMNTLADAGSVYLFSRNQGGENNWGEVKKIKQPIRNAGDRFGISIAVKDTILVICADSEDEDKLESNTVSDCGSAYVYYKNKGGANNWGFVSKLVPSDRQGGKKFGHRGLAIGNSTISIGAILDHYDVNNLNSLSNAGSIYIFEKDNGGIDNWNQLKKITAPYRFAEDRFGFCIEISGDDLFVSSPYSHHDSAYSGNLAKSGSVYHLNRNQGGINNWGIKRVFNSSNIRSDQYFGLSMDLDGDKLIVGTPWEQVDNNFQNPFNYCGAIYVYIQDRGGVNRWGFSERFTHTDRNENDCFAIAIAIQNDRIISGALNKDEPISTPKEQAGAVYIFESNSQAKSINAIASTNTVNLTWTNGTSANRCVFIKQGDEGFAIPENTHTYTADTVFGMGTQINTSGWYCVYNGHGSSVEVSGLKAGKSYRVMVCEYDGSSGSEIYKLTTANNNPINFITDKYSQSISLNTIPSKTWGDPDFYLTKNASSGLKITYSTSNNGIVSISGDTAHIVAAGSCTIYANQAGDTVYFPAPEIQQSILVNKKDLTITAVNKQKFYGELLPVFSYNTSALAFDDAISKVSFYTTANELSDAGSYDINPSEVVFKKGNAANYTITYTKGILEILRSPQQISFFPIPEKRRGDPNFELNASVLSGLPIRFVCSDTNVATIDGNTVIIKNAGTATITATQEGNHNFAAATEVSQMLSVLFPKKISSATIDVSIFPNPAQNSIYIQAAGINIISVTILDMLGRTVFSSHHEINTINVSALHPGIYHIKIQTAEHCLVRQFQKL